METQKNNTMNRELIIEFGENAPERHLCKYCDSKEILMMVENRISKYYGSLSEEELEECTLDEEKLHDEARDIARYCMDCWNDLQADLD